MGIVSSTCVDTGSRFGNLIYATYSYTWANGRTFEISHKRMPSLAAAQAECIALIPQMELDAIEREYLAIAERVRAASVNAHLIIPAFPEELPASSPDAAVSTRQREFHRWLMRWAWPQNLVVVVDYFARVWQWVQTLGGPPVIRTYLNIDNTTYTTVVNPRMGAAVAVRGHIDSDVPGNLI